MDAKDGREMIVKGRRTNESKVDARLEGDRAQAHDLRVSPMIVHLPPAVHVVLNMRTGSMVVVSPVPEGSDDTVTLHKTAPVPFKLQWGEIATQSERAEAFVERLWKAFA